VFVDRQEELDDIRELAERGAPGLVVLRGRRRIGKSHLLREALPGQRVLSFQADEQDEAGQLALLAREAARLLPGSPPLTFADWEAAMTFLQAQAQEEPLAVILDEFQYLCASQPALPSIVQRHWDTWDRDGVPVCLVLAGSALSFMEGLLDHGAPLFGRASYRPFLIPLDYRDAAAFAPANVSPANLIRRYGVIGGTPQYQVWAGARPLRRAIREAVLRKGSPLYEEPLQLLRGEESIRDPRTYFATLRAIADGQTRTGEIANSIQLDTSRTTKLLERLTELGYVELREPLAAGRQRARAIWRIADPYFRFWFRYVFRNRSRHERELVDEVAREIDTDLDVYMGWEFEEVCRMWLSRYSPLRGEIETIGSWWSRRADAEIDVVAMRGQDYVFIGSCKWTNEIRGSELDRLYENRALLGNRAAQARFGLFSRNGFSARVEQRAVDENVLLISASKLFANEAPGY